MIFSDQDPPPPVAGLGGTLGSLFRAAREAKGIPLPQAEHETRIRLACLRDLEEDDLSRMSPAYARLFIRDYARYLGIEEAQIRKYLPDTGELGVEGYQYIQNAPALVPHVSVPTPQRKHRGRGLLRFVLIILVAIGGWQGFILYRKLEAIRSSGIADSTKTELPPPKAPSESTDPVENFRVVGEDPPSHSAEHETPEGAAPEPIPGAENDALFVGGHYEGPSGAH